LFTGAADSSFCGDGCAEYTDGAGAFCEFAVDFCLDGRVSGFQLHLRAEGTQGCEQFGLSGFVLSYQ
jgi:hypothetical protein